MNEDDDEKKKERSSLGRDLDSIMGGMSLSDLGIINGRTLTDEDTEPGENGVRSKISELEVEIEWSKEEKIPIHELNIKSENDKKKKKKSE